MLKLKMLPGHLRYVVLGEYNTFPVIVAAHCSVEHVKSSVKVLKRFNKAICWTIVHRIGIPPGICSHKIKLEKYCSPSIENPKKIESTNARGSKQGNYSTFIYMHGVPKFK